MALIEVLARLNAFNLFAMNPTNILKKIRRKSNYYWLTVIGLIAVGMWIGAKLEKQHVAMNWRYRIYRAMQNLEPGHPFVQSTVVVLIGDEEYWRGEPARRTPINRVYLAQIIRALDKAESRVIALDFDLRSPERNGKPTVEHPAYEAERLEFLKAVDEVSQNRLIVLPETVTLLADGTYVQDSDIYDGFAFQKSSNVSKGYINLPFDYRMIPLTLKTRDGSLVKSFSEAVVEASNSNALKHIYDEEKFPYGRWLDIESFRPNHLLSASEVLQPNPETLRKLRGYPVIVGAGWSRLSHRHGGIADGHFTPAGQIQGVFMHANYVESLLSGRVYGRWGDIVLKIIEFSTALLLALIFAVDPRPIWKLGLLILLCIFLLILSYLSFLNFGRFFDFFVPMVLIFGHAGFEQIREWRADAHKYRAQHGVATGVEV